MKIDAINSGSVIIDANACVILEADRGSYELFGFSEGTLRGRMLNEICPLKSYEALSELMHELYIGKRSYFAIITTMKTYFETSFICEINGCLLSRSRARLFFTEISDYVDSDNAEELQQSADLKSKRALLLNNLYNAMEKQYEAIMVIDISGDAYVIRNIAHELFENFRERGQYSLLNEHFVKNSYPGDIEKYDPFLHKNLLEYFRSGNERITGDFRFKCQDGQYHWIRMTMIRLYDADRDTSNNSDVAHITAVSLINVIDAQKLIELNISDALLAAEAANKAKSDFLARVSHDIRTPMNAIIGLTGIIKSNIDNKEKTLESLEKLEVSSGYLLSLINNILDMSRIESGKLIMERTSFDIIEFIEDIKTIITPQIKQKKQNLKIVNNNVINRFFLGDTLRLKQILINLLSNAMKYTSRGGKITLETDQKALRDDWITVTFTISDTGIGMSDKLIKEAFKPFVQGERLSGNYEGSGLGLSIVHNLVQMMNGTINIYSQQGIGSEFVTEIPLETDSCAREDRKKSPHLSGTKKSSLISLKGKNILLAEDDRINAEIAVTVLKERGLNVDVVSDGAEAVKKFNLSAVSFYNCILMDIQMPMMNGFDAAEKIRSLPRADASAVPIIAMTANAFIEDIASAKAHGMNSHIAKPIDIETLFKTLEEYIL